MGDMRGNDIETKNEKPVNLSVIMDEIYCVFKRKLIEEAKQEKVKAGKKGYATKETTPVTKMTSITKGNRKNKKLGLRTTTNAKTTTTKLTKSSAQASNTFCGQSGI